LLAFAGGCVELPLAAHKEKPPPAPMVSAPRPSAPVTADQVNEANARAKAAALQEELDRAAQEMNEAAAQETSLNR
jgi:hypothetical protein